MVSGDGISYSQREPAALAKCSSLTFCEIITYTEAEIQHVCKNPEHDVLFIQCTNSTDHFTYY